MKKEKTALVLGGDDATLLGSSLTFVSCFVDQSHGFRDERKRTVPVIDGDVLQTFEILVSSMTEQVYVSR